MGQVFAACIICALMGLMGTAREALSQSFTPPSFQVGARIIQARFDPAVPVTGTRPKIYMKMDGSAVRAEIRWSLNGEEPVLADYDGVSEHVELNVTLKSGDKLRVEITPFDEAGSSGQTVVKEVVCRNAPPNLRLVEQGLRGDVYVAKVKADSPQGSHVTLGIEGPHGMTIDQGGKVTWKFGPQTAGTFPVKVSGKDDEGAEALLTYTVVIRR